MQPCLDCLAEKLTGGKEIFASSEHSYPHAAGGRAGQGTAASKGLVAGGMAGRVLRGVAANTQRCNRPRAVGRQGFSHRPWVRQCRACRCQEPWEAAGHREQEMFGRDRVEWGKMGSTGKGLVFKLSYFNLSHMC